MSLLQIKEINQEFKQKNSKNNKVLKNINLNIKKEEFITFIGPSGCGKSTLLHIIAGLIKPSSGKILINNKEISNPDSNRVMVFQDSALFPWLSVIENVSFGLKEKNLSKNEIYNKSLNQLKAVNLAEFKDAYPHQLSGGMKQRAAIARALVLEPKILLMDEPFGALDEQTRLILQEELMNIFKQSKNTIIFVTHNIREAVKLSDRIIVFSSTPASIIEDIKIKHSHPRKKDNQALIKIENKILKLLKNEIQPVGDKIYEKVFS